MRVSSLSLGVLLIVLLAPWPPAWAGDPFPDRIGDLVRSLDAEDETSARARVLLDTLAGRAALAETLDAVRREAEAARRLEALVRVLDEVAASGPASAWLARTAGEIVGKDLDALTSAVAAMRRAFAPDSVIARDLQRVLDREDAARLLYEHLLTGRYRPRVGRIGRYLAESDDGSLHVPTALREASERALAAVEKEPGPPKRATGRHGTSHEILRSARFTATRLSTSEDPLLARWRRVLSSPRVLHLGDAELTRRGDAATFLRDRTRLGWALTTDEQGAVRLHRHGAAETDTLLLDIARREAERAPLRARIEAYTRGMESGALRDVARSVAGRLLLVDMALREAGEAPIDPWPLWVARTFEGPPRARRVRADARERVARLAARAEVVAAELAYEGARSVLDLGALELSSEGLDILRSSIFYNPRTPFGRWRYVTEFEDHHTARLFGTYGWNAKVSRDLADYERRIRKQGPHLRELAKTHEKIVIHISGVPPWLSSHTGSGTFEGGGWEDKQAHPPKDLETWRTLIRILAETFRKAPCERYYEFWNEPDLEYWQGNLGDFLALYEATVRVVREVDPEGRVGGVATNQWDGRIHKRSGSDVLNLELMRFAAEHDVPLDFVSWHHFGRPVAHLREARDAYLAEWRRVGLEGEPEWLVTEWSMGGRGTPHAGPLVGEALLAFWEVGVDAQTASCWEEFHARPNPRGFAPWGLMTQQGYRHGTYYVHRFVDRWVRGSQGAAVVRRDDHRTVAVSRKADGVWDVLVWQRGTSPRLRAAWQVLTDAGFTSKDARGYVCQDRFVRALASGEPVPPRWSEAYADARAVFADHPLPGERFVLELAGARDIEVLTAESVRTAHRVLEPVVRGRVLTVPLARDEVLRLRLRVR